jgi:hypothetical protein
LVALRRPGEGAVHSVAREDLDVPLVRSITRGKSPSAKWTKSQAKRQLRIKPEVFETGGGGEAALRAVDRAMMVSRDEEVGAHVSENTGQPVSIAECGRQRLGGADVLDHPIVCSPSGM